MLKKLLKNEFVRNVATLLSGVTIAQAILLAITPILSRLYSEEAFGIYFLFTSVIIILKIIANLRLELAIMLPARDKDAVNVFVLSLIFNLLINSVFFILIIFFKDFINNLFNEKNLGIYLYFVPLATFFVALTESLIYWNNRKKHYKNISASKISKAFFQGSWNLIFGFLDLTFMGLIPAYIFSFISTSIVLLIKSTKEIFSLQKYVSLRRMLFLLKKYKDIPRFNTFINLTVNLSNEIPVLMMSNFFGPVVVGLYGMANKLIATPSDLVSRSVGQVFFQEASEKYGKNEQISSLLKKTLINLLKIGLIIFIPALIFSPFLKYILGQQWAMTGIFAMIIIPYLFSKFLFVPISSIYTVLNKQRQISIFFLFNFISRVLAIFIAYKLTHNALIVVISYSAIGMSFYILMIFYLLKVSKNQKLN